MPVDRSISLNLTSDASWRNCAYSIRPAICGRCTWRNGRADDELFADVVTRFESGRHSEAERFSVINRLRRLLEPFLAAGAWSESVSAVNRFAPALAYVHDHLERPMRVDELAATVSLHPTYFANRFAREIGCAPSAYIRGKRVEAAQMMLQRTAMPIKEIAAATGFRDAPYFCRVFRSITGCTPREYRERGAV